MMLDGFTVPPWAGPLAPTQTTPIRTGEVAPSAPATSTAADTMDGGKTKHHPEPSPETDAPHRGRHRPVPVVGRLL